MLDLISFNKALKSTWIKKYLDKDNQGKWKLLFDSELQNMVDLTFSAEILIKKTYLLKHIKISHVFLKEILLIWSEISYEDKIKSKQHFLSLNLWNNSLIRIGNKPIYYRSWASKGVEIIIEQVMKDEETFLSLYDFKELFGIQTNFVTYYGLLSAIKTLKKSKKDHLKDSENENVGSFLDNFIGAKQPNRMAYEKLVVSKQKTPQKSQSKWAADCNLRQDEINWKITYKYPFQCTKISVLTAFQFKLLHRRLATNDFLKKIGSEYYRMNCALFVKRRRKL